MVKPTWIRVFRRLSKAGTIQFQTAPRQTPDCTIASGAETPPPGRLRDRQAERLPRKNRTTLARRSSRLNPDHDSNSGEAAQPCVRPGWVESRLLRPPGKRPLTARPLPHPASDFVARERSYAHARGWIRCSTRVTGGGTLLERIEKCFGIPPFRAPNRTVTISVTGGGRSKERWGGAYVVITFWGMTARSLRK